MRNGPGMNPLTRDQLGFAVDWLDREVILVPDAVARRMELERKDGWQEAAGFGWGQSRPFPAGTWMHQVITALLDAYAAQPIPAELTATSPTPKLAAGTPPPATSCGPPSSASATSTPPPAAGATSPPTPTCTRSAGPAATTAASTGSPDNPRTRHPSTSARREGEPLMNRPTIAVITALAAALLALTGCATASQPTVTHTPTVSQSAPAPAVKATTTATAASKLAAEQQSAVESAKDFLDVGSYSRTGLINQLMFDGYSTKAATAAVDSLAIDYKAQAAHDAEQYLRIQPFSRKGLIAQLEFDGYTRSQAVYGADQAM
jgi:colicin import membrane protein